MWSPEALHAPLQAFAMRLNPLGLAALFLAIGCASEVQRTESSDDSVDSKDVFLSAQPDACTALSDCERWYPGLEVSACNPTNQKCRCFDGSGTRVLCETLADAVTATCAKQVDCAADRFCGNTQGVRACLPRKPLGESCGIQRECQSGICVDGQCASGAGGGTSGSTVDESGLLERSVAVGGTLPRGLRVSPRYRVLTKLARDKSAWNASRHGSAIYEAFPDYPDPETVPGDYKNITVHFGQVDTRERLRFRVELLTSDTIDSLELKPSRISELALTTSRESRAVEFEVDASDLSRHILVEINEPTNSPFLPHGLLLFVNPMSTPPATGNVLTLPEGIVDTSNPIMGSDASIDIPSNSPYDTLYIPSGTIVNGRIHVKKSDFKVMGRGIVTGSRWKWPKSDPNWYSRYPVTPNGERVKALVEISAGGGTIEGIVSVHPYHFNFGGGRLTENTKALAWRHSSDGIHGVDVARGNFTRVNDDHIYFASRRIERNTHWGMTNGTIYQGGWGADGDDGFVGGGGRIRENDVVRGEWTGDGGERQNNGVFGSVDWADSTVKDVQFVDIRVQGSVCRMLNFDMERSGGSWTNFLFKDIAFEEPLGCSNGEGTRKNPLDNLLRIGGTLSGFTFENVTLGGNRVGSVTHLAPLRQNRLSGVTFR